MHYRMPSGAAKKRINARAKMNSKADARTTDPRTLRKPSAACCQDFARSGNPPDLCNGKAAVNSPNCIVTIMLLGLVTLAVTAGADPPYRLVYNPSESAPRGWYALVPTSHAASGELVLVHLPKSVARLADERGYLPMHVPILKRVGAQSGDEVCATRRGVFIAGTLVAQALKDDSRGRPLPRWNACRKLNAQELFLLSTYSPFSFDSRYFGPVKRVGVIGRAIPLWTW
jgi:conjugative transfer signal peptidase TraF